MRLDRPAFALALLLTGAPSGLRAADPDPWPGLKTELFQNRSIAGGEGAIALEAPVRAEDAAIVPMTLRFSNPDAVKTATLVIDQNPMPMAASFTLGSEAGVGFISTRVRVNSYTNVHAVVETRDGALHADLKFVKAAGGCSAPAVKDQDEARAHLGQMKYREFKSADPARREAQIMIRHPNNSGMQMDQMTRLYLPAHYVDRIEVRQGEDLIFTMEGGISLSEDPNFRFSYRPNGGRTMSITVHDNKGNDYKAEWPIAEAS